MSCDPVAYTYEADAHCPTCAEARFGLAWSVEGKLFKSEELAELFAEKEHRTVNGPFIGLGAQDSEGNEPGAQMSWEEWYNVGYGNQTLTCGTCHEVIDTYEEELCEVNH